MQQVLGEAGLHPTSPSDWQHITRQRSVFLVDYHVIFTQTVDSQLVSSLLPHPPPFRPELQPAEPVEVNAWQQQQQAGINKDIADHWPPTAIAFVLWVHRRRLLIMSTGAACGSAESKGDAEHWDAEWEGRFTPQLTKSLGNLSRLSSPLVNFYSCENASDSSSFHHLVQTSVKIQKSEIRNGLMKMQQTCTQNNKL